MHMNKARENYNFKKKRKNQVEGSVKRLSSRINKKLKTNENSSKDLQTESSNNLDEARESCNMSSWNIIDRQKFKTIFEVLEDLKAKKLLTDGVVDILTAGSFIFNI